jgi:pyruvate,water dikinase
MEPDLAVYLIKEAYHQSLLGIWKALGFEEAGFADLFRSFEGNRTLEMNREWFELVAALSADPGKSGFLERLSGAHDFESGLRAGRELAPAAAGEWEKFLRRNGHSTTSWDLATPTWADDPATLKPLLEASAQAGARRAPEAQSELREQARGKLFGALALARVRCAVERLEAFMRIDEEHHFLSGMLLVPSRRLVLEAGAILATQGLIDEPGDVFFLTIAEVNGALAQPAQTLRFVVRRRRSERARARGVEPPFELPAPAGPAPADAEGSGWRGLPMSPGSVVGRVRIAEHIEQAKDIAPGTILVTTSPNPALTPIYPLLGGLVTATGSSLSHGFVSAREYSLPAVSGIPGITRLVREGDLVRVDGSTGRVEILEGETA